MPPPRPLTHLEPKSTLSLWPCPFLCPSLLALWTDVPSLSCPNAVIAVPKGHPAHKTGSPSNQVGAQGSRMAWGTNVCRNWTVPGRRCGDGREGRYKWCWLTGYIFDTFNELIQTFHTRKDSPVLLLLCFGLCLCSRGVCRPRR